MCPQKWTPLRKWGKLGTVRGILENPNTCPHSFLGGGETETAASSPIYLLLNAQSTQDWQYYTDSQSHVLPPSLTYACPLCAAHYLTQPFLTSHLVVDHFRRRLLTAVPVRPPYSCPRLDCCYTAARREDTADHLGQHHPMVLLGLVRELVPRFDFAPATSAGHHEEAAAITIDGSESENDEVAILG